MDGWWRHDHISSLKATTLENGRGPFNMGCGQPSYKAFLGVGEGKLASQTWGLAGRGKDVEGLGRHLGV